MHMHPIFQYDSSIAKCNKNCVACSYNYGNDHKMYLIILKRQDNVDRTQNPDLTQRPIMQSHL